MRNSNPPGPRNRRSSPGECGDTRNTHHFITRLQRRHRQSREGQLHVKHQNSCPPPTELAITRHPPRAHAIIPSLVERTHLSRQLPDRKLHDARSEQTVDQLGEFRPVNPSFKTQRTACRFTYLFHVKRASEPVHLSSFRTPSLRQRPPPTQLRHCTSAHKVLMRSIGGIARPTLTAFATKSTAACSNREASAFTLSTAPD